MSDTLPEPPPLPGDSLGSFLSMAERNTRAAVVNVSELWARLARIDRLFQDVAEHLDQSPSWVSALLLIRSHSAYRAAVRLSSSGQLPEAYAVMRTCLEYSLYARYLEDDPERQTRWLQRSDSPENRRAFRREFTTRVLFEALQAHDSRLAEYAEEQYQFLIDYGAHPNDLGLASVSSLEEGEERIRVETAHIQAGGEVFVGCLLGNARVGVTGLLVFETIFDKRFPLLGISERLQQERRAL